MAADITDPLNPRLWHRHGMHSPAEIQAMVAARLEMTPVNADIRYEDFLSEPTC
ncbi:hypothetical protein [Curtobacterium sp. MCBD17_030]|uniref:hypothetical protein n=1 Tax=Curtobacterium sp. MCBD17_030 TaxID=2175649 RepID=UPI0015E8E8BA|nr:hypothetical protein [Curtobacterium sp. MCBD17_030]